MIIALAAGGALAFLIRLQRLREEQRPVNDRIASIREDAAMMIRELQRILERHSAEQPALLTWIPPVLDYYRRLESLTLSPSPSAEQCRELAQEASGFVREHRLSRQYHYSATRSRRGRCET
jgi:hypothetical protein